MDAFDFSEERPSRTFSETITLILNTLTLVVLLAIVLVGVVSVLIFINPHSSINPFPPPTQPTPLAFPTATPTPFNILPPTWTLGPSLQPSPTLTPSQAITEKPTPTPGSPQPGEDAAPTNPPGETSFIISPDSPVAVTSLTFYPDSCNWMGVAGQIFDLSNGPVVGVEVRLGGAMEGKFVSEFGFISSLSGMRPLYGTSGYEIKLADTPTRSIGTLWLQLVDQAGLPLSDKVYFDTYENCEKNLILINFQQVR